MRTFLAAVSIAAVGLVLSRDAGGLQDKVQDARTLVLSRLNEHRTAAGLSTVEEDPELSKGCQAHADYVAKNKGRDELKGQGMHREEKTLPGFSEAGHLAAANADIAFYGKTETATRAVDSLLATLYHRASCLRIRTRRVGIGVASLAAGGGVVVVYSARIDTAYDPGASAFVYPAADQKEVPTLLGLCGEEWPDPRPDPAVKAGNPVTVIWDTSVFRPEKVEATLRIGSNDVPFWLSTPQEGARKDKGQPGVVCLLPRQELKPSTTYTVTVRACNQLKPEDAAWTKTWSFTTAAAK